MTEFCGLAAADAPVLAELERQCFSRPWPQSAFLRELQNPLARWLLLKEDDEIVAYGGMWIILDEAHVNNIVVRPDHWRQGLGRLLLRELFAVAAKEGATGMTLEVRAGNAPAIALYTSEGFEQAGLRPGYYDGEDAIIMWKRGL